MAHFLWRYLLYRHRFQTCVGMMLFLAYLHMPVQATTLAIERQAPKEEQATHFQQQETDFCKLLSSAKYYLATNNRKCPKKLQRTQKQACLKLFLARTILMHSYNIARVEAIPIAGCIVDYLSNDVTWEARFDLNMWKLQERVLISEVISPKTAPNLNFNIHPYHLVLAVQEAKNKYLVLKCCNSIMHASALPIDIAKLIITYTPYLKDNNAASAHTEQMTNNALYPSIELTGKYLVGYPNFLPEKESKIIFWESFRPFTSCKDIFSKVTFTDCVWTLYVNKDEEIELPDVFCLSHVVFKHCYIRIHIPENITIILDNVQFLDGCYIREIYPIPRVDSLCIASDTVIEDAWLRARMWDVFNHPKTYTSKVSTDARNMYVSRSAEKKQCVIL